MNGDNSMALTIGLVGLLGVGYLLIKQQQTPAPVPLSQSGTPQPGPRQFRTVGTYPEWLDWLNTHSSGVYGKPAYPQPMPWPQKGPIVYYAGKPVSPNDAVSFRAPDVPYPLPWLARYPSNQEQMQAVAAITYLTEPMAWEVLEWWQRNAAAGRQPYEGEWHQEVRDVGTSHGWTEMP